MVRHALSRDGRLAEPADRLLRRHGRDAQGAAGRAAPGHDARSISISRCARCPIRMAAAMTAMPITITASCASSSTGSASTTSSSPRPIATRSGRFDETLKAVLRNYDAIMGVMLPTLGEERRKTYSPVLPISPASGKVLQVPIEVVDAESRAGRLRGRGRADRAVDPRRAAPSCSGRSIGRCAGSRSASITRCRARI